MLEHYVLRDRRERSRARAASPRPFLAPGFLGLAVAVLGTSATAQTTRLLVSTTSDVAASGAVPELDDASLVAAAGGRTPVPQFFEGHWLGQAGFVPTDLDAFGRLDSVPAGHLRSFAVSLLSNEGGFQDGDVLVFAPGGGLEVLFSEDEILAGLGVPGAAADVDALDFDDLGRLLFSLQNNLPGTVLGDLEDGDVLRLEFDGSVTLVASEPVIQARFSMATGLGDAINDVQGIEWSQGRLHVAVQSPSSYDGAVLDVSTSPSVVVEEDDVGLGGAEIDALSFLTADEELACMTASATTASPGDPLHLEIHGRPGEVLLVVTGGAAGWVPYPLSLGFGGLCVDPRDPWLQALLGMSGSAIVILDANGFFEADYSLPTAPVHGPGLGGVEGWTFQVLTERAEFSAPFRIEMP